MKLIGTGLTQAATLFVTRVLAWGASVFAVVVAGTSAAANAGATPETAAPKATLLGFSQTQSAALLIALLGLIAIVVAADTIARAWMTAASSDPVYLDEPWLCAATEPEGVIGSLVAIRPQDKMALFVANTSKKAEWKPLKTIKVRDPQP